MSAIERLLRIMARLRAPDGCPWDREQTFATIASFTIEEAYEVADAIAREDWKALKSELGDLLLQVVYHAQMARERGLFDFEAVAAGIAEKMVERHPHVFGDDVVADRRAQNRRWEEVKAAERGARGTGKASALDDLPLALPALVRAAKLQRRAAAVGFDWPEARPVLAKLREELAELEAVIEGRSNARARGEEIGDLLFAAVNLARHLDVDAEAALRAANDKFERRFRALEARARARGLEPTALDLEALDALWDEVKAEEAGESP